MEEKLIESLFYILPAVVTGYVAYYMFNGFLKQQYSNQQLGVLSSQKKEALPIKLQAYERMLLFCDRINPIKMLARVSPVSNKTEDYVSLLIATIQQEFEHNLVQQLYVSNDSWIAVQAAKQAIINKIKSIAETSSSASSLRENILIEYAKEVPASETAVSILKSEVKKLL